MHERPRTAMTGSWRPEILISSWFGCWRDAVAVANSSGSQETAANGCREISSRYHHRRATSWCSGTKGGGVIWSGEALVLLILNFKCLVCSHTVSVYFDVKNQFGTNALLLRAPLLIFQEVTTSQRFVVSFKLRRKFHFSTIQLSPRILTLTTLLEGEASAMVDELIAKAMIDFVWDIKCKKDICIYMYSMCIYIYIDRHLGFHIYIYIHTIFWHILTV